MGDWQNGWFGMENPIQNEKEKHCSNSDESLLSSILPYSCHVVRFEYQSTSFWSCDRAMPIPSPLRPCRPRLIFPALDRWFRRCSDRRCGNDAFPVISGHFLGDLVCPSHPGLGFVVAGLPRRCGPEICVAATDGTAVRKLDEVAQGSQGHWRAQWWRTLLLAVHADGWKFGNFGSDPWAHGSHRLRHLPSSLTMRTGHFNHRTPAVPVDVEDAICDGRGETVGHTKWSTLGVSTHQPLDEHLEVGILGCFLICWKFFRMLFCVVLCYVLPFVSYYHDVGLCFSGNIKWHIITTFSWLSGSLLENQSVFGMCLFNRF